MPHERCPRPEPTQKGVAKCVLDVAIVERRANQGLAGSRAGGLHSRTIEVLDQRGIAERFLAEGQVAQVAGFAGTRLDISDFPTRHNYGLGLRQNHIERILAGGGAEGLDDSKRDALRAQLQELRSRLGAIVEPEDGLHARRDRSHVPDGATHL